MYYIVGARLIPHAGLLVCMYTWITSCILLLIWLDMYPPPMRGKEASADDVMHTYIHTHTHIHTHTPAWEMRRAPTISPKNFFFKKKKIHTHLRGRWGARRRFRQSGQRGWEPPDTHTHTHTHTHILQSQRPSPITTSSQQNIYYIKRDIKSALVHLYYMKGVFFLLYQVNRTFTISRAP